MFLHSKLLYLNIMRVRARKDDGKIIESYETYCGRKTPYRVWKGKKLLENQIWNLAELGVPDLIDGDLVIEAKGGLPSSQKVKTALGQPLLYRENEPSFRLGFLFPKFWLETETLQNYFDIFGKYEITVPPI